MTNSNLSCRPKGRSRGRGFSLVELLVAVAVFLLVAGSAFMLFSQHAAIATRQQNLSGVNIGLRNAMAQLQMDLASAGQNLLAADSGAQPFNLGVIIHNNVVGVAAPCAPNTSSWAYPISSACFDSISIINPKRCTTSAQGGQYAPVLVINDPGNGNKENLATSSNMFADDPTAGHTGNPAALTADATCFLSGDEVLVIQLPTSGTSQVQCSNMQFNYCMTVVTLTQNGSEVGQPAVKLQHNPTGASGQAANCPGTMCSDPLGITTSNGYGNALGPGFTNGAFIIDLGSGANDVTYAVQANPANPTDPQLIRCAGAFCTSTNYQVVTDQVIGFKVGAALWDNAQTNATDIANYFFDASKYCNDGVGVNTDCTTSPPPGNDPYDFTLIRSVRISMVGRTVPQLDPTLSRFKNGFDQGPYLIQQASVVVDLRNMTIPDYGN